MLDEPSASRVLKVALTENKVLKGRTAIMITIMMGKMEMVFPDMYMINRFIGACLIGPKAKSHDRLAFKVGSVGRVASAATDVDDDE